MNEAIVWSQAIKVPWWRRWRRQPTMILVGYEDGTVAVLAYHPSATQMVVAPRRVLDVPGWVRIAATPDERPAGDV